MSFLEEVWGQLTARGADEAMRPSWPHVLTSLLETRDATSFQTVGFSSRAQVIMEIRGALQRSRCRPSPSGGGWRAGLRSIPV